MFNEAGDPIHCNISAWAIIPLLTFRIFQRNLTDDICHFLGHLLPTRRNPDQTIDGALCGMDPCWSPNHRAGIVHD